MKIQDAKVIITYPGHGVDIDEDMAAKYPYQRACLPINRLVDGAIVNW